MKILETDFPCNESRVRTKTWYFPKYRDPERIRGPRRPRGKRYASIHHAAAVLDGSLDGLSPPPIASAGDGFGPSNIHDVKKDYWREHEEPGPDRQPHPGGLDEQSEYHPEDRERAGLPPEER